ncbi:uncharacterized protein N7529_007776 [Penicillium soppii]|uniref:uncharacterized protein n=1 Tax=Penicillium soppii TaxID=69789 RepID=UPI002549209C|nr:uncharacterized protein N7529_007776 [Penicillium soppii]KAJ5860466.1 hypothetical protein N7529_007776 [Penicillium soppii]
MGNICSRSRNETDNFNQPGRIVGSNPRQHAESPRAPVPTKTNWKGTPGRTLSGSDGRNIEQNASGAHENADEARANAAIAAQKRAEAASGGQGKLGAKLAKQKGKTGAQTLAEVSQSERDARDADQVAKDRNWD